MQGFCLSAVVMRKEKMTSIDKIIKDSMRGYTRDQLQNIFSEICDPDNWKECIQATIPASDFDLADTAVCYFTGGGLEIVKEMERNGEISYDVFGHGYYVHIGA